MFESRQKVISNQYPAWKYLLLLIAILLGSIYAAPNLFGDDPSVQISPAKSVQFNDATQGTLTQALADAQLEPKAIGYDNNQFLIRFHSAEDQLKARSILKDTFGRQAVVALNLAPATPDFLRSVGPANVFRPGFKRRRSLFNGCRYGSRSGENLLTVCR